MKKTLILIGILFYNFCFSQVTNSDTPKSWALNLKGLSSKMVIIPKVNSKKLLKEDSEKNEDKSKPKRFGFEIRVDLNLKNAGTWTVLKDGGRIWRLNIFSEGAKTLNFVFNKYYLPSGASLYIYSNDKSKLLGAYTDKLNRDDYMLGTWPIEGENVWLEYYEPNSVKGLGQLNLQKVIHGYRNIPGNTVGVTKSFKQIESCNYDVNCSVGSEFDALKEQLKHSVALIVTEISFCSGVLINNTNNDKAPFFLTANHCNIGLESTWAFRFNYLSNNTNCGLEDPEIKPETIEFQTTSGASVLASNSKSDFKLLRLDGGLNPEWNLEWAGWDHSSSIPKYTVCIHHPDGREMKVSKDNNPPEKTSIIFENPETDIWKITDTNDGWELGVTEVGSSGSPLFSPQGRIKGQLTGGLASCSGITDNNLEDWFGRFDVSWDFGDSNKSRLSDWLDPINTGQVTLNMLSQEIALDKGDRDTDIAIFPNPVVSSIINVTNSNKLIFRIFNLQGKLGLKGVIKSNNQQINLLGLSNGIYFLALYENDRIVLQNKIVISK